MLWVEAFHIVFMVTWFAGLFYLPRLYVYHASATDGPSIERFKIMERKLYWGIATPGGIITILLGLWLWGGKYGWASMGWLHAKLTLVGILVLYHVHAGKLLRDFKRDRNRHGHVFYRWYNEFPVLILIGATILVVVKPF